MKTLLAFSCALFVAPLLRATVQTPDRILRDGQKYSLLNYPLEYYFAQHPDRRPQGVVLSSDLWRGYIATFEIKDKQVFVKDIAVRGSFWDEEGDVIDKVEEAAADDMDTETSVMKKTFPGADAPKAGWMTGMLEFAEGEWPRHEHFFLLEILEGDVAWERALTRREYLDFSDKRSKAFWESDAYKARKYDGSLDVFDGLQENFNHAYTTNFFANPVQ